MGTDLPTTSARQTLKYLAIRTGLTAIALSGASRLFPAAAGRGVIFTLHHVRPSRHLPYEPNGLLSVTPEFLDDALAAAIDCGLTPVHLEDLPALLSDPEDERRFFCVTLDDGYRDNAVHAVPILRRHQVPYTVFVTEGFVERSRTIWWETAEALTRAARSLRFDFGTGLETVRCESFADKTSAFKQLAAFVDREDEDMAIARIDAAALAEGIDPRRLVDEDVMCPGDLSALARDPLCRLGAHTMTHANLARVDDERLVRELGLCADAVTRHGGRAPTTFAYPYGGASAVSARTRRAVADAGFRLAVTTQPGVLPASLPDGPIELPRVSLNGHFQRGRYVRALVTGLPFRRLR